jgi:hypothetical protein
MIRRDFVDGILLQVLAHCNGTLTRNQQTDRVM